MLKHWACAKIAKSKASSASGPGDADTTDDDLCKIITAKFRSVNGGVVSYAEIAKRSWEVGRPGLATKARTFAQFSLKETLAELLPLVA